MVVKEGPEILTILNNKLYWLMPQKKAFCGDYNTASFF